MAAGGSNDQHARDEAAAWFAKLRAPDAADAFQAFEAWYASDPGRAEAYDRLLESWEISARAGQTPAGRVRTRLGASRRSGAAAWLAAAAVAAVAFVGLVQLRHGSGGGAPTHLVLASALGEIRTLDLGDGSHVTLDSLSRVEADITSSSRVVTLRQGRARFQVAPDRRRPFTVRAGASSLVSQGGIFDAALGAHDVHLAALKGSAEVHGSPAPHGLAGGAAVLLGEGMRLRIGEAGALSAPLRLAAAETQWPQVRLWFEDTALAKVIAEANRHNKVQIRLASPGLGALRFTGAFAARDPEALARLLAATFGLAVSRDDAGNYVIAGAGKAREAMPPGIGLGRATGIGVAGRAGASEDGLDRILAALASRTSQPSFGRKAIAGRE